MRPLTPRQAEVLRAILDAITSGLPPTIRELSTALQINPYAVQRHLAALQRKQAIQRQAGKARAIRVVVTA